MKAVAGETRSLLLPVAQRVFWWGEPNEWLDDTTRFVAQVMVFGNWDDARLTLRLLGDAAFQETLRNAPPGVFDIKSWVYWHVRYHMPVPPLPTRKL